MYLIIASRVDEGAERLRGFFPREQVRMLTPSDICQPGWQLDPADVRRSTFVAEGERFPASAVRGVVSRLPCVYPPELIQVVEEARVFVASEMTAMLKHWLSGLNCAIFNPPTPGCLSGPSWRREHWATLAADVGVPPKPYVRGTRCNHEPASPSSSTATVTQIGDRCIEECEEGLREATRAFALRAGTPMLSVTYAIGNMGRYEFVAADTFPDLDGPRAVEMILDYFQTYRSTA